jgi:hypothetical protein
MPCVIVFGGENREPLSLQLDADADEVAKSLRGHSLQRIEVDDRVVWINPQNVLYVENATGAGLTTAQARGPNPSTVVE